VATAWETAAAGAQVDSFFHWVGESPSLVLDN
jgi:hypothetical protein